MKFTKVIAVVLSLMMILGTMPMMAFATANVNLADAIADVMGTPNAEIITDHVDWGVTNLDFTDASVAAKTGITIDEGITFDANDGAIFPAGATNVSINYTNIEDNSEKVGNKGWGPISCSDYLHIAFKLNEGGSLTFRGENTYRGNEFFVRVIPNSYTIPATEGGEGVEPTEEKFVQAVQVYSATDEQVKPNYEVEAAEYNPGTEWNDLLVKKNNPGATTGGYSIYMKKASDAQFTLVATAPFFQTGTGAWITGSLTISGRNAAVREANNYIGSNVKYFDSIEDIMGVDKAELQLTPNYDFTREGFTPDSEVKYLSKEGYDGVPVYTPGVGMTMDGETSTYWYADYASNPMVAGTATVFAMKHTSETDRTMININTPDGGCTYAFIAKDKITSTTSTGNPAEFAFGTEPFELLYLAKEQGYAFYARNAGTNNRWVELTNVSESRPNGKSMGTFSIATTGAEDGVVVSSVKMYGTEKIFYDSIEEIMGITDGKAELQLNPYYDFAQEGFAPGSEVSYLTGETYDGVPVYTPGAGLTMDGNINSYWYADYSPNPMVAGTATVFKMKHTADTDKTMININTPDGGCTYATVTKDKFYSNTSTGNPADFAFGTEPFELLYLAKAEGYAFYARNAKTNGLWKELINANESRHSSLSRGDFSIAAGPDVDGFVVSSIKMYGTEKVLYDSVEDMMDVEETSNWFYSKKYTGTTKPEEVSVTAGSVNYTADGIVFPANAAATVKIAPETDHWKDVNTTVIKGKFGNGAATEKMFILANTPNASGRHYLTLYPTYLTTTNGSGRADFNFGTDWFELAIVSYEGSHKIFVKNKNTNGKWLFLIENTNRDGGQSHFSIQSYATNTGDFTLQSMDVYKEQKSFDSIEEIMGIADGTAELQLAPNYDFTQEGFTPDSEMKYLSNDSYDGVPVYAPGVGMTLDGEKNSYWYAAYASNPLVEGTATVFAMQHTSETDKTMININTPDDGCTYATITKDTLYSKSSTGNPAEFAFGTDPFELLYLAKAEGYAFYARNAKTNNIWVELTNVSESRQGSSKSSGSFSISTNGETDGVVVSSIKMYGTEKVPYYDSIEEIMGIDNAKPQLAPNYDFTLEGYTPGGELKYISDDTHDGIPVYTPGEGMSINGEVSSYWYAEYASNPLVAGTATVFAMKHTAETDKTMLNINTPDGGCTYATITKDTLYSNTSTGNPAKFAFGTAPFELLYLAKAEGYAFYARNAKTNNRWLELTNVNESRKGSLSRGAFSISLTGDTDGVVVSSIKMYGTDSVFYNSIEEIMGGDVVTSYSFDFNKEFDSTIMANSLAVMTTDLDCSDEYGIDLTDGSWNFSAHKSKSWSPLNGNLPGEAYIPQALYFKMKFNADDAETTLSAGTPSTYGRLYRQMSVGEALDVNGATGVVVNNIVLDTNWTEHLIVPSELDEGGYTHYVKSDTLTAGNWVKAVETTDYRQAGEELTGLNLTFSQAEATIKALKTYQLALKDENCKPEDATLLYYTDDFDEAPAYRNLTVANGNFDTEGVISFPAVDNTTYGKYNLNYAAVPVGGYAEFKTSSNGTIIMNITDGVKRLALNVFKPYIGLEGTEKNFFTGEGNNASRIWRVVRTEEGYTIYTKVDGDKGWQKLAQNVGTDVAEATNPQIVFTFRNHSDGESEGSGQLDYMKIYGPAREDKLIVTDGYGTKEFKNGDVIGYGSGLRPIVNAESGKLLIATYEDSRLVRLTAKDVTEVNGHDLISIVYGGADAVKVFLWDKLDGNTLSLTENLNLVLSAPKTDE